MINTNKAFFSVMLLASCHLYGQTGTVVVEEFGYKINWS